MPMTNQDSADFWIQHLALEKHPVAGYFKEKYRSEFMMPTPEREDNQRMASTSIYYLLQRGDYGPWRHIDSDETFHFYSGGALIIHLIQQNKPESIIIGNPLYHSDATLQYTIPANTPFAIELPDETDYALVSCVVTPGFDYRDYHLVDSEELIKQYSHLGDWINKPCII